MRNHTYNSNAEQFRLAILVKDSAFNPTEIAKKYMPLCRPDTIVVELKYDTEKKVSAATIKDHLNTLLAGLKAIEVEYIYCADGAYFKALTKQVKVEANLGYVFPCAIAGYEHMQVVLGVNHKAVMFSPNLEPKLIRSVTTMTDVLCGAYIEPGKDILQNYTHIVDPTWSDFEPLMCHEILAADIETTSLNFEEAEILSIAFAWNDSSAITFSWTDKERIRPSLWEFFSEYCWLAENRLIWHNAAYDLKVLIRTICMNDINDYHNMLVGLDVFTNFFDDTKLIAYLATNNAGGNHLSLKELAQPYAGNYAVDVKNAANVLMEDLSRYNAIDACSTFWVYYKYRPIMVDHDQLDIYETIMLPSLKTIIATEMTGMPMDRQAILDCEAHIEKVKSDAKDVLDNNSIIVEVVTALRTASMIKKNATLKTKQYPIEHFTDNFNPSSGDQVRVLLYDTLDLPVLGTTDTGKPSTDGPTLQKLFHEVEDEAIKELLETLMVHNKAKTILSTFISAFHKAVDKGDGAVWLLGNFNLGGTVSGRLSSSKPNLQNLPSGSTYGKMVKSCFKAPEGWLMVGADFNALEARICALTTKDPELMKIYSEGYDPHSFNAYTYWPDQFPGIDDTLESINTIPELYGDLRSKSKTVTFALQYQGTPFTLSKNSGFSMMEAHSVYENYHNKYKVAGKYQKQKIDQATIDGYVTVAFGLRVRAPLLSSTVLGNRITPKQSEAEARTIGNALSQSYGLLTNRAANAVMERVWDSQYKLDIKLIAMIHDANYFICKDDLYTVEWLNRVLIEEMGWQKLPEISHEIVNLGAELEIYYPSWANPIGIPNGASKEEIASICNNAISEREYDAATKKTA